MISLAQLQQLRELVHATVTQVHVLEQKNALLQQKLSQYEKDMDGLYRENHSLEKNQQLVETEVGELLHELKGVQLEESPLAKPLASEPDEMKELGEIEERAEREAIPQIGPRDSFLEQHQSVEPKQVSEMDFSPITPNREAEKILSPLEVSQTLSAVPIENETSGAESYIETREPAPDIVAELAALDKGYQSIDVALGSSGESLQALEENLSTISQAPIQEDLEIF